MNNGAEILGFGFLLAGACTLALLIIGGVLKNLFSAVRYVVTHRRCPQCRERRPWNITRVRSGEYIVHSLGGAVLVMENPVALTSDDAGNVYSYKYNRICKTCGEKYYVNEGRWPTGTVLMRRQFTKEEREWFDEHIRQNNTRLT